MGTRSFSFVSGISFCGFVTHITSHLLRFVPLLSTLDVPLFVLFSFRKTAGSGSTLDNNSCRSSNRIPLPSIDFGSFSLLTIGEDSLRVDRVGWFIHGSSKSSLSKKLVSRKPFCDAYHSFPLASSESPG